MLNNNISEVKITILVDDHQGAGNLRYEHGLSFWIEVDGYSFLFDTGVGEALLPNAKTLNIDLAKAVAVILSHGHYDHTGALDRVLQLNPELNIYCHPAVVLPRYSIRPNNIKYAGMQSEVRQALDSLPEGQIKWQSEVVELIPGVGLTGAIPRNSTFEDTGGPFFLDQNKKNQDLLEDDQAMWIKTAKGLIIVLGCCHSGLVNTVNYIKQLTGEEKIQTIIGGMHLLYAKDERLNKTCQALEAWQVEQLIPCHCTGEEVIPLLKQRFPKSFINSQVGASFSFN
jgi:7,8-dihydropterin-6-yl-methyl-4-(beta-D-ribofuranosyl)aminobenzene 5'-phosphate synthase